MKNIQNHITPAYITTEALLQIIGRSEYNRFRERAAILGLRIPTSSVQDYPYRLQRKVGYKDLKVIDLTTYEVLAKNKVLWRLGIYL